MLEGTEVQSTTRLSARWFWVLVHRYAGLYMAFFLVVAGLTGCLLSFVSEIYTSLNPPVKVAPQAGPRLDEFTLRERAQALVPGGRINALIFNRKADEAYQATVEALPDPATGKPRDLGFNNLLLNPYTGTEMARVQDPDVLWPITRKNFVLVVLALHFRLAIPGTFGSWLFGIAALIWTIDCFVGFYLTLPLIRRKAGESVEMAGPKVRSWWSRWWPSWALRLRGSNYRIQFNLHRAGGLWVWPMLFVFAWSSVALTLDKQIYTPLMKTVFRMKEDELSKLPDLPKPRPDPVLDWREAHRIAQRLMDEQAKARGFKVAHEESLAYAPSNGNFYYSVQSDRDISHLMGGTILAFDGSNGGFKGLSLPRGENAARTFTSRTRLVIWLVSTKPRTRITTADSPRVRTTTRN